MTGDLWTPPDVGPDVLSALSEEERYRRFDALQARMPEVWESTRLNHDDESVVVIPSITLDRAASSSGSMTQAMEERFLFLLTRKPSEQSPTKHRPTTERHHRRSQWLFSRCRCLARQRSES